MKSRVKSAICFVKTIRVKVEDVEGVKDGMKLFFKRGTRNSMSINQF